MILKRLKIISITLVLTSVISTSLFSTQTQVFASELNDINKIELKNLSGEIIKENGKEAIKYTSSDTASHKGWKATLSGTFIEDPHSDKKTALLNLEGFIPSDKQIFGSKYYGKMKWPETYRINVKSADVNNNIKIANSIPKNTIDKKDVSNSIGYSIGGNISVEGKTAGAGINASYNVQNTISYEQPDFRTIQRKDDANLASWDIKFVETKDGYNIDSYHAIYGNQLFMKSRLYNNGDKNFTDDRDLSTLISGGFSPNMALALTAPKNAKESVIIVEYQRFDNDYILNWETTQWRGTNKLSSTSEYNEFMFKINWQDHKIEYYL
uniref:NetB toxin protein n=7 Tax=Clostridium perfringens TaxID=1502 RepID=A0A2P0ZHP7_CLOPF|nr:NetB toxin protein [Clostridium perfringens]